MKNNLHPKIVLLVLSGLFLTGCATTSSLYQWGGYDAMLYQSYKNPEKVAELRKGLELHIEKMETANQKLAPGLYAELGTLYLQGGEEAKAVEMYTKERNNWPESQRLMDTLITNITKRAKSKAGAKS